MLSGLSGERGRTRAIVAAVGVIAVIAVGAPMSAPPHGTTLSVVSPADGATVSGTVSWRLEVEGRMPKTVYFEVDRTLLAQDDEAPFETTLETMRLENGTHVLTASSRGGLADDVTTSITVANAVPIQPALTRPVSTSLPALTGSAAEGSTLAASVGTWSGSSPMAQAIAWLRCDNAGGTCSPIPGDTDDTYTVTASDVGRRLRVEVEATNTVGSGSATSLPTDVIAPSPVAPGPSCTRPYSEASPWNTPIGPDPVVVATSNVFLGVLGDDAFTSQPLRYAYPVYTAESSGAVRTIIVRNTYNDVSDRGSVLTKRRDSYRVSLPMPADATPSEGTDGHLIVVDPKSGDEWGFWQAAKDETGQWYATNGYHYNVTWSGVPPTGFGSRGAGVTYLAGLIRACEIAQGRVDHALAFAYNYPKNTFVYPATKSDGLSTTDPNLPEGARLQLDPSLGESTIRSWGCVDACLVVARAMQRYGMYLVDNSGRDKIYTEDESTARWGGAMTGSTLAVIPKKHLRWVSRPT